MSVVTTPVTWERCRLCRCRLKEEDDGQRGVCRECSGRPEAQRLRVSGSPAVASAAPKPRAFTDADRSLIRAMHGYLPAAELLRILNERMIADLGGAAPPYTLEQLHREAQAVAPANGRQDDWTSLRRLLSQARASGLLEDITPALVEDFAVIFQLTVAQTTHVKDVIQHAQERRR